MHTYIFMPALSTVTGGMAVLGQIASQLQEASWPVSLVSNGQLPADLHSHLPSLQLAELTLHKEDRWIVPEGWPAFLAPGLKAQCACAVYVQNWAFLHGLLPGNTKWRDLPLKMFSVSQPVSIFIKDTTGFNAPIIRPAIDQAIFHPGEKSIPASMGEIKIAWMPRKNKHLGHQIRKFFEAALLQAGNSLPQWITIEHLKPVEVAEVLHGAHIFLATGFPEGCPLPPLESMACGCIVAGFTGIGGWDYMRQAIPAGWQPPFPLRLVSWGANGFFAADGDVWGAYKALELVCKGLLENSLGALQRAAYETAASYSWSAQKEEIFKLWEDSKFWNYGNVGS